MPFFLILALDLGQYLALQEYQTIGLWETPLQIQQQEAE